MTENEIGAGVEELQKLLACFEGLKQVRRVILFEGWDDEGESWTLMWRQGLFRRPRQIEGADPVELLKSAMEED